ncbi:hypothetical protein BDR26DRAFT_872306 [Obelidium mucronatum]|nr:hypothetical protein BDR26DRAFT_872306 [Obelidium mucronatum]
MNCVELSADEGDADTPLDDERLSTYALKAMKTGTFNIGLFLKYGNFTSKQQHEALLSLHAVMQYANKKRQELPEDPKRRVKHALKKLNSLKLDDEGGEWLSHWELIKVKEAKVVNRRKREFEADGILTATVAKVRKEEQNLLQKAKKPRLLLIEHIKQIIVKPLSGDIPACLVSISAYLRTLGPCDASQSLLIDLRRNNVDIFSSIPPETIIEYTEYITDRWDATSPPGIQDFLCGLFNGMAVIDRSTWSEYLENFRIPKTFVGICFTNALKVIKITFPNFIRALLDPTAPLQDNSILESRMLNDFIHPLFKESLFLFGNETVWHSGEIPHAYFVHLTRADGVGKMRGKDLPIAYFEGARPASRHQKGVADDMKIRANCVSILRQEVVDIESLRKKMPATLRTFGAQYFNNRLSFCVADCLDNVFLHTFDEVSVPRNTSEIRGFADLYETMFGWSAMVGDMVATFETAEHQQRRSRKSFFNSFTAMAKKPCEEDA